MWSVDHNPGKAVSATAATSSNKFGFSNKENTQSTEQQNTPLSQNGLIANEKGLVSSCPPAQQQQQQARSFDVSPPQKRMSSSFYESPLSQPILAHITNNTGGSVKGVNALSKIAERIKI